MGAGGGENDNLLDKQEGAVEPDTDVSFTRGPRFEEHDPMRCNCCCCFCNCQNKYTRDLSCFGCFPIKCAIVVIGIFTICLNFCLYVEVFYCLMSDTIAWWYVLVGVCLLIPMFLGTTFFVLFFADETVDTRGRLSTACILIIVSLFLLQCWNLTYFLAWYKAQQIYFGTPRIGYTF
jgi:hypothetical protein